MQDFKNLYCKTFIFIQSSTEQHQYLFWKSIFLLLKLNEVLLILIVLKKILKNSQFLKKSRGSCPPPPPPVMPRLSTTGLLASFPIGLCGRENVQLYINVESGVSQGSVLWPCLLLFYIDDMPEGLYATVRLYADDCTCLTVTSELDTQTL